MATPDTDMDVDITPSLEPGKVITTGQEHLRRLGDIVKLWNVSIDRRTSWKTDRGRLYKYKLPTLTIGVHGTTGSGKSTLINNLLDCDILPTGASGEAVTSVPIFISYHDDIDARCVIEFVDLKTWKTEIARFLDDCTDTDGVRDVERSIKQSEDNAIKSVWDKIASIYPGLSARKMNNMTPENVLEYDPACTSLLGTEEVIRGTTGNVANQLRSYVTQMRPHSGSRLTGHLWPIVRHATLHLKVDFLETGIRLIDLPGTGDANTARERVALDYQDKADAFFIVSPITRAKDDGPTLDMVKSLSMAVGVDKLTIICTHSDSNPETVLRDFQPEESVEWDMLSHRREAYMNKLKECKDKLCKLKLGCEGHVSAQTSRLEKEVGNWSAYLADVDKARLRICMEARGKFVKKGLRNRLSTILGDIDSRQLKVFTCASKCHSDVSGGDFGYSSPDTTPDSGICELRACWKALSLRMRNDALKSFIVPFSIHVNDCIDFLDHTLSSGRLERKSLGTEWENKVKPELKRALRSLVKNEQKALKRVFDDSGILVACVKGIFEGVGNCSIVVDALYRKAWSTVRATLRRHGIFHGENLNYSFLVPFRDEMIREWNRMFGQALLSDVAEDVVKLLSEALDTLASRKITSPTLQRQFDVQRRLSVSKARLSLTIAAQEFDSIVQRGRQRLHASLSEWIKEFLRSEYDEAFSFTGRGSVYLQQAHFRRFVDDNSESMFIHVWSRLSGGLDDLTGDVQKSMLRCLNNTIEQCTRSISILWDEPKKNVNYEEHREEINKIITFAEEQLARCRLASPNMAI